MLKALRSNKGDNVGGHILPPNRVGGYNQKKLDRKAPDDHYVLCRKSLFRWDMMAKSFLLDTLRLVDWDHLGFYPAEVRTDHWTRRL